MGKLLGGWADGLKPSAHSAQRTAHTCLTFHVSRFTVLLALAACAADAPPDPEDLRGALLPQPLAAVDFTLTATDGTPFAFRERTAGNTLTLLFFGYTSCPDICPVHMANLAAVLGRLPPQVAGGVGIVMVTVDPERDTPERLRSWLDHFDRSFVGLTGTSDEVSAVMQSLRLPPAVRETPDADGSYLVGHAAQVLVVTSDGLLRAMYPAGTRQTDWAHDLPLLVAANWEGP